MHHFSSELGLRSEEKMNQYWMQEALRLAEKGLYTVAPNPMVGCVIVKDNQVLGRGFHSAPGQAHAEINALKEAGLAAKGASLYVTLEPCTHFGLTPPCVNALLQADLSEIWVATRDPNPLVSGQGIAKLKAAGLCVHEGLLEEEARALNRIFFHYITTKTPYLIAKTAQSWDGKMQVQVGDSASLSCLESLKDMHHLRQATTGILIGSGTALKDNPALTTRYVDPVIRHPERFILNTQADLPPTLRLFDGSLPNQSTLICAAEAFDAAQARFNPKTTRILAAPTLCNKIDLKALLPLLGKLKISSLLIEGGPTLLQSFYNEGLIQEVITYLTPFIIANLAHKQIVQSVSFQKMGNDYKMRGILPPRDR